MSEFKAWTYTTPGYPECLRQTASTLQATLSPTEIQVQIKAAALNPVDIQLMNVPLWSLPYLNYAKGIGADFSGIVLKAGAESEFNAGDEVFGLVVSPSIGTVAEIVHIDTKDWPVLKKPKDWSWGQAAALPLVWLTARTCITCVEPYVGESKTVAILGGSSATGMYAIHLACQRGWKVIATCSDRNADFVRSMGASEVVDYTQESVPDRIRAAKPDAIIDCVGGVECIGIAKRYVTIVGDKTSRSSMGGSVLYFTHPRMVLRWLAGKTGWGEVYDAIILDGKKEYLQEATELPTDMIVIDSTFQFAQVKEAFERLNTGRTRGKVVIEIESSST
jgi:NADPH:quinone reductase-like Zn-dependent oxidoreductase